MYTSGEIFWKTISGLQKLHTTGLNTQTFEAWNGWSSTQSFVLTRLERFLNEEIPRRLPKRRQVYTTVCIPTTQGNTSLGKWPTINRCHFCGSRLVISQCESLNMGILTDFTINYMHCLCLGLVRGLVFLLTDSAIVKGVSLDQKPIKPAIENTEQLWLKLPT